MIAGLLVPLASSTTIIKSTITLLLGVVVLYGVVAYITNTRARQPSDGDDEQRPASDQNGAKWRLAVPPLQMVPIIIALYLVTQIAAWLLLEVGLSALGYSSTEINDLLTNSSVVQFIYIVAVDMTTLGLVYRLLNRNRLQWRDIGLVRPKLLDAGRAVAAYIIYMAVLLGLLAVMRPLLPAVNWEQQQELGFDTAVHGLGLLPVFVSLVLLPPITEEILMRGVLFTGLRRYLSYGFAAVIVSLLFASAHLQIGSGNALLWTAALDTLILSLVLVHLRETTGSLWSGIFLHGIKNFLAFMALFIWS